MTLADVYRALAAGSLAPKWCSGDPESDCMVGSNMGEVMNEVFCGADQQLERYLESITIGQMLSRLTVMAKAKSDGSTRMERVIQRARSS